MDVPLSSMGPPMDMTPSDRPDEASPRQLSPVVTVVAVPLIPFMLIGLIALVYGGTLAVDQWRFLRRAAHAKGTVVGLNKYARGAYPIVRYGAPNGDSIQFQSRVKRSYGVYKIEQQVDVLYDPADRGRAEIDSSDAWYAVLMLPLFGGGLSVFSLLCLFAVYRFSLRRRTTQDG